jgi:hypothetical protein
VRCLIRVGVTKIDIHSDELFYKDLTFSDLHVVKLLIQYRYKYDQYHNMMVNNHFNSAGDVKRLNKEMINTFVTLDELIDKCKFNADQMKIIHMVQDGYSYKEIANELGILSQDNAKKRLHKICRDIVKQNLWDWRKVAYTNVLGLKTKQCSKCRDELPAMDEFYSQDERNKDGFQSFCRKCDNYRKKGGK